MSPTSAQHTDLPDGTTQVVYNDGVTTIYPTRREASISSMLRMFPGTSREWLEKMHAINDARVARMSR